MELNFIDSTFNQHYNPQRGEQRSVFTKFYSKVPKGYSELMASADAEHRQARRSRVIEPERSPKSAPPASAIPFY